MSEPICRTAEAMNAYGRVIMIAFELLPGFLASRFIRDFCFSCVPDYAFLAPLQVE